MKNKPLRHKEYNTFKFQSFSERISNINVDVYHRVGHKYEEIGEDETDTFFYIAYRKWNKLNKSEIYHRFKNEIDLCSIKTLPELLLKKERVVNVLLEYLEFKDPLSLQAFLELVVALAQDLTQDFYMYYPQFHSKLLNLLNTKDTDQLEWTFSCLAYLFKSLWRYIVKDLVTIFDSLLPLLSSNKPQYINNFAADSFAFVARKVKDKRSFLKLILGSICKTKDGMPGYGRLLFATVCGVSNQFHTCAQPFLNFLLNSLIDEKLQRNLLFQVLDNMVEHMTSLISPQHCQLFWNTAQAVAEEFFNKWNENPDEKFIKGLHFILQLMQKVLKWRDTAWLNDSESLLKFMINLLQHSDEKLQMLVVDVTSVILTSSRVLLTQELSSFVIHKVLSVSNRVVIKDFIQKTYKYSGFDLLILRRFVEFSLAEHPNDTINLWKEIILFKAPPRLNSSTRFLIDFQSNKSTDGEIDFCKLLLNELNTIGKEEELIDNFEGLISILLVVPHFEPLSSKEVLENVLNLIKTVCCMLEKQELLDKSKISKLLFVLLSAMKCFILTKKFKNSYELNIPETVVKSLLPFIKIHSQQSFVLHCLSLCLDENKDVFQNDIYNLFLDDFILGLSSPYHQVRLLSANLLFKLLENDNTETEITRCLSLIVKAESLPATVHDYREKLKILQKIECCPAIIESKYQTLPLQYLLGVLYVNFKLVWEPVTKLITSYAIQLPKNEFWMVFHSKLVHVKEEIQNRDTDCDISQGILFENADLSILYSKINVLDDKPDHKNYRNMLWKAMREFPEICESKNRDIVPLFLTFLEEEYYRLNADIAANWNIKLQEKKNGKVEEMPMEVDDGNEDGKEDLDESKIDAQNDDSSEKVAEDLNNDSAQITEVSKFMIPGVSATKCLLAHICVFGKFRDPKSVFKESELRNIYYELLTHKNPEVQKSALECIMAYKFKHVSPYRDHLFGLIDDKSFKDEIVLFRIDQESDVVRPEHREDLMPIVMRILYSKMLNKSGTRNGSKTAGQLRRSLVLRFLAGCHPDEIMMYLQMAFRIYSPYIKDDPLEIIRNVDSILDLGSMIPPRRLQSSVNLLVVVLTQCGGLMSPSILKYLLQILFTIGRIVSCALNQRDIIHPGYVSTLRMIRNSSLDALSKFFVLFESYAWTPEELDVVFEVFVWPWLPKLSVEGVHSPTALLKLFIVWSKFQRYFPLLGKHDSNNDMNPLKLVMELLVGAKTHNSVCNAILEMVERLLTLQDLEEEQRVNVGDDVEMKLYSDGVVAPLIVNNGPVFDCQTTAIDFGLEKLNYGSYLMLNHIPSVLERLKVKMSKRGGDCRLRKPELTILSRVTELVSDPATCDTLLSLILPIMLKKAKASDDVVCPILNTLYNLIKNVCNPGPYIYKLAPLFGIVSTAESRKLLTQIIISISKKESDIDEKLIEDINAFDKRWIEQPDFNRRSDAFKRIKTDAESENLSVCMGVIIIHNCFYFLKNEKDLSIRDNAVRCLQHVCPALCLTYKSMRDLLIDRTILPLISSAIRDKKCDVIQQEAVALLGYMVRECSDLHPVLKDMSPLGNKVDMEVDFFENLHHMQLHRRVRALLKLSDVLSALKKSPGARTLTQFLLPLITQYLCNEKYLNKNTIVDASIKALETICKLLSWHQYELVLRYYLGKLQRNIEYQKQLVRVVVSVLNGFHFDLSRASLNEIDKDLKMDVDHKDEKGLEDRGKIENSRIKNTENIENEAEEINQNDEDDENEDMGENELLNETEKEEKEFEEKLAKATEDNTIDGEQLTKDSLADEIIAIDKITVLNKSSSLRVVRTIKNSIFVQLLRAISMRSQSDIMHKLNRKQLGTDKDEEDVLRIPIALAAVKLLQRLPAEFLEQNLSGILMKLCTFLKSKLDSVRRITRETLQKVMKALGPDYLPILIKEMTELLTKGFHVHVLIYTLHSVLVAVKDLFQPGHVDKCLQPILEVCQLDLFGNASEEKEVAQIAGKLMEARANKSYDVFHVLGEYVTENCLLNLVLPLKEELCKTLSHKVVRKVAECLRQIVLGLVDNKFVSVESILIFAYGVTSESIPSLITHKKNAEEQEKIQTLRPQKPNDTFIIPEDPKGRPKVQTKQCAKTNAHLLVEFGLQLYHFLLKREKVKGAEYKPHMDPVVPLLQSCLQSEHMKINSLAIQCLCWVLKKDLPSLKIHIKSITQVLFSILHKYASAGLSKGDNFDLVMAAFKAVAVIVRDVKYYQLERDHLQALLLYCEQDIHDNSRQATAFTLLKAILGRKLNVPELHEVIMKVEELCITSHLDHSRLQARQIVHQFMSDYKLGKKLNKHLNFFITHLDYDLRTGRESALEMLHSLINTLPEAVLKDHSGLLFVSVAVRLVNDDIPECRQKAAEVITSLLQRINKNERNNLFDIVLLWLKDKKVAHRRLGAQLCGIFITIEQGDFENNVQTLFPIILKQFYEGFEENQPGMFVRIAPEKTDDEESLVSTMQDHHLYQLLNMLVKLMTFCPKILVNSKFTEDIEVIADNSQRLLGHPHEWVRYSAIQLLGCIISVLKPEEVADIANGDKPEKLGFFMHDTRERLKSFALDHSYQLMPGVELSEKLLMRCMKNVVFVAEVLQHVKSGKNIIEKPPLSLSWLVRQLRKLIHMEVAQQQSASTVIRTMVFHWMAAIALKLKQESLLPVAHHLIAPLVREMNIGDEGDATLKQIAKEAAGYVRRKIGLDEYNRLVTNCTSQLDIKRAERRKERAQQAIVAPEKAAKRKIMKQQKKKILKKRKIEALKNHKLKRKSKQELDFGGNNE